MTEESEEESESLDGPVTDEWREADEVFVLMKTGTYVSRHTRMSWLFHNLNRPIFVADPSVTRGRELMVAGVKAKGVHPDDVSQDVVVLTKNTDLYYVARAYRHVYVIDMSNTNITLDEQVGCVLYPLLVQQLRSVLHALTQQICFPAGKSSFSPRIIVTVVIYTPHLTFNKEAFIIRNELLTCENVQEMSDRIQAKFDLYVRTLFAFSQPFLAKWTEDIERTRRDKRQAPHPNGMYNRPTYKEAPTTAAVKEDYVISAREERDATELSVSDFTKTVSDEIKREPKKEWRKGRRSVSIKRTSEAETNEEEGNARAGEEKDSLETYIKQAYMEMKKLQRSRISEGGQNKATSTTASHTQHAHEASQSHVEQLRFQRTQWEDTFIDHTVDETGFFTTRNLLPSDHGYIHPEWGVIYMIRLGMLALQLHPHDHSPSNIIIVTDTLSGIPQHKEVAAVIDSLRDLSITCSFLQLLGRTRSDVTYAHVASATLMHFIARASSGGYIPGCRCINDFAPSTINVIQKELLCWWPQKSMEANHHLLTLMLSLNKTFTHIYLHDVQRHYERRFRYECSLRQLIYVRLQEGYCMKRINENSDGGECTITLALLIRPKTTLEFTIHTHYPIKYKKREVIQADLELVGPAHVISELIGRSNMMNGENTTAYKEYHNYIARMVEGDRLMMHLFLFNKRKAFYTPPLVHLYRSTTKADDPFTAYWKLLLEVDESLWLTWTHTHDIIFIMHSNGTLIRPFTRPYEPILYTKSLDSIIEHLKQICCFTIHSQDVYVDLIYGKKTKKPKYACVLRLHGSPPLVSLRASFIGGASNTKRNEYVRSLSAQLNRLLIHRDSDGSPFLHKAEYPSIFMVKRPIQRMLVRYNGIPPALKFLFSSDNTSAIPSLSHHNAMSNYLHGSRIVWRLPTMFNKDGRDLPYDVVAYFVEVIMRRRLTLGYTLTWMHEGVIGLCRQTRVLGKEDDERGSRMVRADAWLKEEEDVEAQLEQLILFPPVNREDLLFIDKSLGHSQHVSFNTDALIVEEMWRESEEMQSHKIFDLDADTSIVASLFTIDKLLRICAVGGRRAPIKHDSCPTSQPDSPGIVLERFVHFSLGPMMRNSVRHLVLLPLHCKDNKVANENRAKITLEILHEQMADNAECILEVPEKETWTAICGDLEASTADYANICSGSAFILYMKKTSPWSVVGVALPVDSRKIRDWSDGALPLLFFSAEEPCIVWSVINGKAGHAVVEDRRMERNNLNHHYVQPYKPMERIPSHVIMKWRGRLEGGGFKAFDLWTYVKNMNEGLLHKCLVTALYRCLNEREYVSEKAMEDVEELCDAVNVEVGGVDGTLRALCDHSHEGLLTRERIEELTEKEPEFEMNFTQLLSKHFRQVGQNSNYFHYRGRGCAIPETDDIIHKLKPVLSEGKEEDGRPLTGQEIYERKQGEILRQKLLRKQILGDIYPRRHDKRNELGDYVDDLGEDFGFDLESGPKKEYEDNETLKYNLASVGINPFEIGQPEDSSTPLGVLNPRFRIKEEYETPIFLYFSCAIRVKGGPMETFPINAIPSCLYYLLKRSSLFESCRLRAEDVELSIDMYLLTWPMPVSVKGGAGRGTVVDRSEEKKALFLSLLPTKEREVLTDLLASIGKLIEHELILLDSRRQQMTEDRLESVSKFITRTIREAPQAKKLDNHFVEKRSRLRLVNGSADLKEQLRKRLDGKRLSYCRLRRKSDFLYASTVADEHLFEEVRLEAPEITVEYSEVERRKRNYSARKEKRGTRKGRNARPPEMIIDLSRVDLARPDLKSDFWLLIRVMDEPAVYENYSSSNITPMTYSVQFCQRYPKFLHHMLFEEAINLLKAEVRCVNQLYLLNLVYESGEMHPLLVPKVDAAKATNSKFPRRKVRLDTIGENDPPFDTDLSHTGESMAMRGRSTLVGLNDGDLECAVLYHKWFYIPSRLTQQDINSGVERLRHAFAHLATLNKTDIYVIKERGSGNIFYIQLHSSTQTISEDVFGRVSSCASMFNKHHILYVVHGVEKPTEELTVELPRMMYAVLRDLHLSTLVSSLTADRDALLEADDIQMMQPLYKRETFPVYPKHIFYVCFPTQFTENLVAFDYYLQQHIQEAWPEARYKDERIARTKEAKESVAYKEALFGSRATLQQNNHGETLRMFESYFPQTLREKAKISRGRGSKSHFNIVCKNRESDSDEFGVGVLENRLVDEHGLILPTRWSKYEHYHSLNIIHESRWKELLNVSLIDFEQWKATTERNGGAFLEANVWVVGELNIEKIQLTVMECVRQACMDVITEYAFLNNPYIPFNVNKSSLFFQSVDRTLPYSPQFQKWCETSMKTIEWFDHALDNYGRQETPHCISGGVECTVLNSIKRKTLYTSSVNAAYKILDIMTLLLNWETYEKEDEQEEGNVFDDEASTDRKHRNEQKNGFNTVVKLVNGEERLSYIPLDNDLFPSIEEDNGFEEPDVESGKTSSLTTHLIIALDDDVWNDIDCFARSFNPQEDRQVDRTIPPSILHTFAERHKERFMSRRPNHPNVKFPFVPRKKIVYLIQKANKLQLYMYNLSPNVMKGIAEQLIAVRDWHETKLALIRQVSMHKMGITHVMPPQTAYPGAEGGEFSPSMWSCVETLVETDYPPTQLGHVPRDILYELTTLYRRIESAFLVSGRRPCRLGDQLYQLLDIRKFEMKHLLPHHQISQLHHNFLQSTELLTEKELSLLCGNVKEIHFVLSPLLLFPDWRRKIATIRMAERERQRTRQATEKQRLMSRKEERRSRTNTGNVASSLSSQGVHQSGEPVRFSQLDDDPCQLKVMEMLVVEYAEYLVSLGMRQQTFQLGERKKRHNTAQLKNTKRTEEEEDETDHPKMTLVSAVDGGFIVCSLSFKPPYFVVKFSMWSLYGTVKAVVDHGCKDLMRDIEEAKNELVSSCHVHSFTYDFHLRMISKYLLGKDNMLFPTGYNIYAFFIDFMQYYCCRPPAARNCIYEDHCHFELQHTDYPVIQPTKVWGHFLDNDVVFQWKVLKMKGTDGEGQQSAEYMLIQSQTDVMGESNEIRVVMQDGERQMERHALPLIVYILFVSKSHKTPMNEERRRDDSKASDGEFKHLQPHIPAGEYSTLTPQATIDEDVDDITRMVALVTEGKFPAIDETPRRFASGGDSLPILACSSPITAEVDSTGSMNSIASQSSQLKSTGSDIQLAVVQSNAPRRHRRVSHNQTGPSKWMKKEGAIPQESSYYIHYMSAKQRRMQKVVEDAMALYRRELQKSVSDAEWICRRDELWKCLVALPDRRKETTFFKVTADQWHYARSAALEIETVKELDTLLSMVLTVPMSKDEPNIPKLIEGTAPSALCRHLVQRFGIDRCRFFEYHQSEKKCLLITNPNSLLDTAVLVLCEKKTVIYTLIKERGEDLSKDGKRDFKLSAQHTLIEEVMSTVMAFSWEELQRRLEISSAGEN